GWDRKTSGDPSGWTPRIKRALRIEHPPTPFEMIRYMKGVRLDFAPGTRQVYSNFGFVLLGAVVARVCERDYPESAHQVTLQPMGIEGMRLDEPPPNYFEGEARRYMLPGEHALPGGNNRMVMAAGGWAANCMQMAKLLTAIDGSRTGAPWLSPGLMQAMVTPAPGIQSQSPEHWMGLGWDQVERFPPASPGGPERFSWGKDGGLAGIETWIQHLAEGADFALLFNSGVSHTGGQQGPLAVIRPKVIEFIRGVRAWPEGDLFAEVAGRTAQ
ncbi:MAG: beta-lactamase family protein, partial [Phycisphaerae bacterium]|nr:beta-lactamase family protein [Phycisphaerae bacterium]